MAPLLPLYLNLSGRKGIVVGGGSVGERRAVAMLEGDMSVTVVSPSLTPELSALADARQITWTSGLYSGGQLQGSTLACAATDVEAVNEQVCRDGRSIGVLVNRADDPDRGDFVFPACVRRGDLCISITTGGASPILAARLQSDISGQFGPEWEAFVALLGECRGFVKTRTSSPAVRRRILASLVDDEAAIRRLLRAGQAEEARARALSTVEGLCSVAPEASPCT